MIARDLLGGAFASGWFWPLFGATAFAGTLLAGRLSDANLRAALVTCYFVEALGVTIHRIRIAHAVLDPLSLLHDDRVRQAYMGL